MKNTILKSMLALSVVAFAASMLAVSCNKTAGGGGNNNANNSGSGSGGNNGGGSGGGEPTCTGICPSTSLTLRLPTGQTYVKISGNTVYMDASRIATAGTTAVHSGASDTDRSFSAAKNANAAFDLFHIDYPSATAAMIFVFRPRVTKDTVTLRIGDSRPYTCSTGEMSENTMADSMGGGVCRAHLARDSGMYINSYLGTVFNNTKTTTHARGIMMCEQLLGRDDGGMLQNINDTIAFNRTKDTTCYMASINDNLGNTVTMNDAWVGDSASVKEVELYAIGIDVTDKTIPQWSDAAGYGRTAFMTPHDNAAVKRLLKTNKWGDLKFKIRVVNAAAFAALR